MMQTIAAPAIGGGLGAQVVGAYGGGIATGAPMMTTMAAPQMTYGAPMMSMAAPQMTYGAPLMQTIAAPVVEIDQVNAVGQVVERDVVQETVVRVPNVQVQEVIESV